MQKRMHFLWLFSLGLLISFSACKKETPPAQQEETADIQVHADDELFVSSEIDRIFNDANVLLEANNVSPRNQENTICDATVSVDIISDPQTITISFNGGRCITNLKREGEIVLSANKGMKWQNAGSSFKVRFNDFKLTRSSDNKSITINGDQTYTNLNGGLLSNLSSLESVVHTVVSNGLSITFPDGSKRTWQVSQKRVYTYDNGIVATVTGMRTDNGDTQIAVWGTNRFGTNFTSSITTPLVIRQDCNFRLTDGVIKHTLGDLGVGTGSFGLDANGQKISCPAGNYYYKLEWEGSNGATLSFLLPY